MPDTKNSPTDEELICLFRSGDASAMETLMEKYKPLARSRASLRYLSGGDADDLLQEGMIGLYRAIQDFDPEKAGESTFFSFARLCIDRQILKAIERTRTLGNLAMNGSVPLTEEELEEHLRQMNAAERDPEHILLDEENRDELLAKIRAALTPTERKVLELRLADYGYREIAQILGRTPKSVDNALQRIRKKSQKAMEESAASG
ncbi:MAG: sigma-70 family RNA polymerase sigma factor [Lachnospiraceae bacterium]